MAARRTARVVDIARAAGVSPGTVSKALNNSGALRESTRDRVYRAAAELGFSPDPARRPPASRSFTVGLLSADSAGRFSIPVMLGAENALAAGQLSALLATSRNDPVREAYHVRSLVARRVDGIIVAGRTTDARPRIDVPIPVVYAFAPSSDPDDASVMPDDADGARRIVDHLLGIGRRRIVHVAGRPHQHSPRTRAEITAQAVHEAGLELAAPTLFGEWSESWGRRAVDQLLQAWRPGEPLPMDAISCGSDQIARGVCDRLRELDLRVPDEIAVTGFDDWDVMALASRPPLTTIDLRLEYLGQRAAELLLDAIDGRPHHGIELTGMELVPRASTGWS
ncbi:LacI family DNA-binding transcriptional regulator [Microlunatus parietis]|uniref:LacI family transcriptional regulator n=1 Tax=Microlunatus parietis TaxID=682979 RepID=A0A7Y9I7B5_9ACTN|nr:LacI family DNA-binding transcriptional regulator [Microlunatus parietis]NYE71502.1 LacI family transcriptional regulator [Microlunatus parietis]